MSVKELWEEECALCAGYHCSFYVCPSCLIGYAVVAGASKKKLVGLLNERLKAMGEAPIDNFNLGEARYIIKTRRS